MKALTVWQPWATLIVLGLKKIETRRRKTRIRGRIAVHAALRPPDPEIINALMRMPGVADVLLEYFKYGFPLGEIVGNARLADCCPIDELYDTRYATHKEMRLGDWTEGRFGWIMESPVLFDDPIPAAGRQGFWNWEPGIPQIKPIPHESR